MNKLFLIFVLFILLPCVLAADIGYIVKTPVPLNSDELAIKSILESEGHSVAILDDDYAIIFNIYDIIIVGSDVSNIGNIFDNKNSKTLFLSYVVAKNAGLSKYSGTTTGKELIIENTEHFITEGIGTGTKTVYKELSTINYLNGCKARNSTSLAYKSDNLKSSLLVLNTDSLLLDETLSCSKVNVPIYERNVFFGLPTASKWNTNGEALFVNSIDWLLHGSDEDEDGFYYDRDCNDKNASIYPGAEEIPYNGVDEDCNGEDLEDVDEDGYKAEEVGGNDCDDNDVSINPGSSNVYKNCKNDAPIISPISGVSVDETENATIEIMAVDPEDDSLEYSINDSRFVQGVEKNVFTWQTDYDDAGDYLFKVIVGDGNLTSQREFEVKIRNKNRAPVCNNIPSLEWNEDEKASFDLKSFCHDEDGDAIYFYINDTSSESHILLDSLENGIANFSSEKDWSGEDWIIFKVSDGKDYVLTNNIALKVLPVNDAPIFTGKIEDITWNEDTNLVNYLNLSKYFSDVDNGLVYNVVGAHFVNVAINNSRSLASFYPQKDWSGEENVVFSASDGEFLVYSNAVTLKVLDANEPPEFGSMNCKTEILEDTQENCGLNASDFENDALTFSIVNKNKLQCSINGNNLEYISDKDYNGQASCLIRVSDGKSYDEYLLEVNVTGVNDAPVIKSYSPQDNTKIMENTDKLFSIVASDIDSNINISWFLDNTLNITGNSYLFNKGKGNYEVKAEVTDGEFTAEHLWNVFVGSISDFTCEEVGGDICAENEICLGNLLGVKDTNSCCEISCSEKPPAFSDAEKCENKSSEIEVKIENPDKDEEFMIEETIDVEVKIKNGAEEDLDFDINAYLYDITEDEAVEDNDDSVDVDMGDSETVEFEFKVPENLNEKDDYAIFVKAVYEDYCNENYVKINIEREKHNVIIEEVKIEDGVVCGDYADVDIKVKNLGSKDEDVSIKIENSELNISEKSEEFELEKYNDKDEATKSFKIKIPDNAEAGNYTLKATAAFEDGEDSIEKELILGECKKPEEKISETEIISLQGEKKEAIKTEEVEGIKKETEVKKQNIKLLILLISTTAIALIIIYLLYVLSKKE